MTTVVPGHILQQMDDYAAARKLLREIGVERPTAIQTQRTYEFLIRLRERIEGLRRRYGGPVVPPLERIILDEPEQTVTREGGGK